VTSETTTVKSQAARVNGIGVFWRLTAMLPAPLQPEHALAYLRELQPEAEEVAVIGPGGALLAGVDAAAAVVGRELLERGGELAREGSRLAAAAGGHAIAARLPDADAGSGLAAFDLQTVASAIGVSFAR
jgi:hypothetical protein